MRFSTLQMDPTAVVAAKDNTGKGCHRLTGPVDPKDPARGFTAYLMDSEDSSKGIVLHMGGGDL